MIIREWRGWTTLDRSSDYPKHFRDVVIPELREVPGFLGASLGERRMGERVEFVVLTRWKSMEAIRGFAGPTLERAVVEPGGIAALTDFDDTASHYDVLEHLVDASG